MWNGYNIWIWHDPTGLHRLVGSGVNVRVGSQHDPFLITSGGHCHSPQHIREQSYSPAAVFSKWPWSSSSRPSLSSLSTFRLRTPTLVLTLRNPCCPLVEASRFGARSGPGSRGTRPKGRSSGGWTKRSSRTTSRTATRGSGGSPSSASPPTRTLGRTSLGSPFLFWKPLLRSSNSR